MKTPPARVRTLASRPDPALTGYLLFGPDPTETDALRARLCRSLIESGGPGSEVTRMDPQEIRRDPAALGDALRAMGLFGGRPIVLAEGVGDGLAGTIERALTELGPEDGVLVATAGALASRSALRKVFETGARLAAMGVYSEPLGRSEVLAALREAGVREATDAAVTALMEISRAMEPSETRGMLTTLGLYMAGETRPADVDDVTACAPTAPEGDVDAVIAHAAARDTDAALAALGRAQTKGVTPSAVAFGLGRQFRQLHAVASSGEAPENAVSRLRPPVFGPRREAMLQQLRLWPIAALEAALGTVLETELLLRSSGGPPDRATVERLVVRITMMKGR